MAAAEEEDECDRWGGRIVGVETDPVSGETEVLLRRKNHKGPRKEGGGITKIAKDRFIAMPVGRIYAERGGECRAVSRSSSSLENPADGVE